MDIIQIVTKGDVSFPARLETTAGYRYDIPFDNVSLPSLALSEAIREQVALPEGTIIGRAHPAGYLGLIGYAGRMLTVLPNSERFIREYYTKDRFDPRQGFSIRSLKPGNTFEARISFPPKARQEVQKALHSITHLRPLQLQRAALYCASALLSLLLRALPKRKQHQPLYSRFGRMAGPAAKRPRLHSIHTVFQCLYK